MAISPFNTLKYYNLPKDKNLYLVFLDGAGYQFGFEASSDEEAIKYTEDQYRPSKGFKLAEIMSGVILHKVGNAPIHHWV